ncbi:MAG: AMP-binding protein [Thermodesulfobacteriota bacterium]|nr:AMP-binding protein [Thermodesulfobacteriota bacterium]
MIDKSKRYVKPILALEDVGTLKGKRLKFDSVAEMLVVRSREIPDFPYALYYDEVVTFAQVNERANRVANYLKAKGVGKGDIVSTMVLNSPEIFYSMFGAQKLGAIAGATNYMLKGPEIAYVLDDSKPKVAFVGSEYMKDFANGWQMARHKPIVVEVVTGIDHGTNIAEGNLKDILAGYPADECFVSQTPNDPFLLLYSSGTAGLPKGILLANKAELSVCTDLAVLGAYRPGDVAMVILPMFHTNPLCCYTYPFLYQGLTLCIRKSFSTADFWPSIMKYGVTSVMAVPAMYAYVYNTADPKTIDYGRLKLRRANSGAAPMPLEIVRGFKEKFNIEVTDGYGLTEGCGVTSSCFNIPDNRNSIGMALPSQEVEIMDDDNKILPYGEKGEICIKGDSIMIGYLNKPKATAEAIRDGWLHTGDVGYMDEMGYLYISGRKKEMINRGGENIYPREIEIPLERHPKIAEVAVVGIADPALGERVKACIVLKEPGTMTSDAVKEYLKDKIAKYKIPESVEFMANFPRNPTGKVLKEELKKALN